MARKKGSAKRKEAPSTGGEGGAKPKRVRRLCSFGGCGNISVQGGVCIRHGAEVKKKKTCLFEGCTNQAKKEGVCRHHGAEVKTCSVEGCSNQAVKGGVCKRHGGEKKKCSCKADGCTKHAVQGGVCIQHGAVKKHPTCKVAGCTNNAKKGGVCKRHGAKVIVRTICSAERCNNKAQRGGRCESHGAKRPEKKTCSAPGCPNQVQNGGLCVRHGAQRKKCSDPECTNQAKKGGVCHRHGAKVKKYTCKKEGCSNQAVKGGVCKRHGGEKKKCSCKADGCTKHAVQGGVCIQHGAVKKHPTCKVAGCTNNAKKGGVCKRHGAKVIVRTICSAERCNNKAQRGGRCESHGAKRPERKKCSVEGCDKYPQKQKEGMCQRHYNARQQQVVSDDSDDGDDGQDRRATKRSRRSAERPTQARSSEGGKHDQTELQRSNEQSQRTRMDTRGLDSNVEEIEVRRQPRRVAKEAVSYADPPDEEVDDVAPADIDEDEEPEKFNLDDGGAGGDVFFDEGEAGLNGAEKQVSSRDLASELSKIDVDTRLEVYDSYDGEYHAGVVSEIHVDRAGHVCSIRYDDDETGTINLDEQHFRIIDEAGGQVNEVPRQNGGDDAPEGARQEENTTEVASLLSLAGDTWGTLNTLAQYLALADIKSLRLASRSLCHLLPAKDKKIVVRPFATGRQCAQFFKFARATEWFARPHVQFDGSGIIEKRHRKQPFFQETNCLNQVQSLKVSKPSSYSFLYRLGDVPSLEELKIYKGPVEYGRNGPKLPVFLENIRHLELTKCAMSSPQTRLLGKAANLKGLKLRLCQPDIEHTNTDFFGALSEMSALERFKFVPTDLIRPLDVVGQDEDEDDDDDNEQEITRQAAAEHLHLFERGDAIDADEYTLLSNRILCAVCSKPGLKSLSMRNVELREGVGIRPLRQLGRLEELCLSSLGSFEGSDLSLLGNVGANTLKKLTLVHCRLLESELQRLTALTRLEELSLIMVCLRDEDLQSLAHLTELKSLNIFGRISGEADLSHLRHLQKLKHLSLQIYGPVDSGFASQLDSLESLESLWLRLDCVDDEEDAIPTRAKLVSVNVDDEESTFCSSVGDRSMNACASVCSHGTEAQDVRVVQDHPLGSLASLSNLRSLLIYDTVLTDGLIETISSSLGKLTELSLWDCQNLSETSISYLVAMKPLERLTLHRFDTFTETGLELLAEAALDELESLEFYLCSNLAHVDIGKLGFLRSLRKVTVCPHFEQCDLPSHITLVKDERERKAESRAKHLLRKIKNNGMF